MTGNKSSNSVPESEKQSAKKAALGPSADHSTDFDPSVDPSADSADPPAGPPRKWTFTKMADIPLPIRSENISKFSVEFLHQGMLGENLDIPANHCVARLTFQNEQEYDTDYAAAGTKGILIDLHFDPNAYNSGSVRGPSHVGQLHIKPFKYDGKHWDAAYDFEIPMKRTNGMTFQVKDFLQVIQSNDLIPVSFNLMEDDAVACKDFNSQYLYCLNRADVLDIPANTAQEVYSKFNYNYQEKNNFGQSESEPMPYEIPVGYAVFNPTYFDKHVALPGVAYRGKRLFYDPATEEYGGDENWVLGDFGKWY